MNFRGLPELGKCCLQLLVIQAKYANNSHIRRDKTTNLEAVYRYRSKPSYLGEDSVELEYSDHQIGSGPDDPGTTTITRQVINITVEK